MRAVAEAQTQQASAMGKWLDLFKVERAPTSRVIREEDEYNMALERAGVKAGNIQQELEFVLRSMEGPIE